MFRPSDIRPTDREEVVVNQRSRAVTLHYLTSTSSGVDETDVQKREDMVGTETGLLSQDSRILHGK